jgi:hypothetical protein
MTSSSDVMTKMLLLVAAGALGIGLWQLASPGELRALYWLAAGGLALKAASEREHVLASR